MKISKLKIVTKFIFGGGVSGVIEYLLEVLNNALASLDKPTTEKVQAVANGAMKVLSLLNFLKIFVPTKWQTAFAKTIACVESCVNALGDLALTKDEVSEIKERMTAAYAAWKSPDDETCVDCEIVFD